MAAAGIRYVLPPDMRAALRRSLGPVLSSKEAVSIVGPRVVATVGDVTTDTFLSHDVIPRIMIIDHRTQRAAIEVDVAEKLKNHPVVTTQARNPPGVLTDELVEAIRAAYARDEPTLIEVEGEEDLATLPAILHAPEGAAVCYGQPNEGVVVVRVDERARAHVARLLSRMEVK